MAENYVMVTFTIPKDRVAVVSEALARANPDIQSDQDALEIYSVLGQSSIKLLQDALEQEAPEWIDEQLGFADQLMPQAFSMDGAKATVEYICGDDAAEALAAFMKKLYKAAGFKSVNVDSWNEHDEGDKECEHTVRGTERVTDIFEAINFGDVATLAKLLRKKPELVSKSQADSYFLPPLHIVSGFELQSKVSDKKRIEMIDLLLSAGADIDVLGGWHKDTPLHLALNWSPNVAKHLIHKGADCSKRSGSGMSPLEFLSSEPFFRASKFQEVTKLIKSQMDRM